jgi:release factor glutamine methyltransferase
MRGTATLRAASIDGAARDAQLLMAHALGVGTDRLILMAHDAVQQSVEAAFLRDIEARAHRQPISHLLGGRMFFDRWFTVTSDVLDPRPETEMLIVAALKVPFDTVLDLGTGSGAIIATLLAERPSAMGTATDISQAALEVAKQNSIKLEVRGRLTLLQSDWFSTVEGRFDLIVANPPYIAADEMSSLQPEVTLHEPRMALTDEADGLSCYRAIIQDAPTYLTQKGALMVEIGPTQAAAVCDMMTVRGFADVTVVKDLDERDRVVCGRSLA